jgi:hypothetical protein
VTDEDVRPCHHPPRLKGVLHCLFLIRFQLTDEDIYAWLVGPYGKIAPRKNHVSLGAERRLLFCDFYRKRDILSDLIRKISLKYGEGLFRDPAPDVPLKCGGQSQHRPVGLKFL